MKRTALLRRTPLARGASKLSRGKPLERTAFKSRAKPLARKPWPNRLALASKLLRGVGLPLSLEEKAIIKRKHFRSISKRKSRPDPEFLAFVRSQPCCACGAEPPNHAHHEILNGRGKGQKAPDARTLPFCFRDHDDFHLIRGKFRGWTREQRQVFQSSEIDRLREIWRGLKEHGVLQEPARKAV